MRPSRIASGMATLTVKYAAPKAVATPHPSASERRYKTTVTTAPMLMSNTGAIARRNGGLANLVRRATNHAVAHRIATQPTIVRAFRTAGAVLTLPDDRAFAWQWGTHCSSGVL